MQTDEPTQDVHEVPSNNEPPNSGEPMAITTDEPTVAPPPVPASNSQRSHSAQRRSPDQSKKSAQDEPQVQQIRPAQVQEYTTRYTTPSSTRHSTAVKGSRGGGYSVTIDATGSWSQLARHDATLPTDASNVNNDDKSGTSGGSGGVFGLFGRKKGRGHSPKPKERGVLGKEGARQIIG